jgi:N-acetylglucosamine malate deacetylase 1
MSEIVMALGSHFDDIEIGCGGTLIKHRDAGDTIILAVLKSDEYLTASAVTRIKEGQSSAAFLGAYLNCYRQGQSIEHVVGDLDKIKPTILYFPFEKDYHQDHNYASQVGFAVSRNVSITVLQYLVTTSHSYYPNVLNVINNMEEKKKLVSLFSSQMERRPKFMEIMEAQNRFFGSLIPGDGHYAEGMMLHRQVNY